MARLAGGLMIGRGKRMRPIDADKMKSYIDCGHLRHPNEICLSEHNVVQMLDKQPTLDVEPVRHGRWIDKRLYLNGGCINHWECSICGYGQNGGSNYCPNCGARMDAKEEYK